MNTESREKRKKKRVMGRKGKRGRRMGGRVKSGEGLTDVSEGQSPINKNKSLLRNNQICRLWKNRFADSRDFS